MNVFGNQPWCVTSKAGGFAKFYVACCLKVQHFNDDAVIA